MEKKNNVMDVVESKNRTSFILFLFIIFVFDVMEGVSVGMCI